MTSSIHVTDQSTAKASRMAAHAASLRLWGDLGAAHVVDVDDSMFGVTADEIGEHSKFVWEHMPQGACPSAALLSGVVAPKGESDEALLLLYGAVLTPDSVEYAKNHSTTGQVQLPESLTRELIPAVAHVVRVLVDELADDYPRARTAEALLPSMLQSTALPFIIESCAEFADAANVESLLELPHQLVLIRFGEEVCRKLLSVSNPPALKEVAEKWLEQNG